MYALLDRVYVGYQTLEGQGLSLWEAVDTFGIVHPGAESFVKAAGFFGPGDNDQDRPVEVLHECGNQVGSGFREELRPDTGIRAFDSAQEVAVLVG